MSGLAAAVALPAGTLRHHPARRRRVRVRHVPRQRVRAATSADGAHNSVQWQSRHI